MIALFVNIATRFGINPKEAERFSKFLVVGGIGFVVDFGTLTLLKELFQTPTLIANTISFSMAVVSNFTLNRYWTYPDSRQKNLATQLGQFSIVSMMGYVINTGLLWWLETPFDKLLEPIEFAAGRGYIPAKMVATVVVLFWNFFVNRYLTYNDVD